MLEAHPTEKQIVHASKVRTVLIPRNPKCEVPIERHQVQVILQHVKLPRHNFTKRLLLVSFDLSSKEIRFPVCQVEAPIALKYKIDEPLHGPAHWGELQLLQDLPKPFV